MQPLARSILGVATAALAASTTSSQCHTWVFGGGRPATDGYVPGLRATGGSPAIGNAAFGFSLVHGLGGAPAVLLVHGVRARVVFDWGTLLVPPWGLVLPVVLAGTAGASGAGTRAVSAAVPPDPVLVDADLFAQWLTLENGALHASNGLGARVCSLSAPGCANVLRYGEVVSCTLQPGAVSSHTFVGGAGDVVLVRATNAGFQPTLAVLDPLGGPLCTFGGGCGVTLAEVVCTLPSAATYTVTMRDGACSGSNESGPFSLVIQRLNGGPRRALSLDVGGSVSAALSVPGDAHAYTISASAGETMFVRTVATSFQPEFTVYDPTGTQVCVGQPGCAVTVDATACVLASPGTYTLVVKDGGCSQSREVGAYGLAIQRVDGNPDSVIALPAGTTVTTLLDSRGQVDTFTFDARAGDIGFLRVVASAHQSEILVIDPLGRVVSTASGGCGQLIEVPNLNLTATGTHSVLVGDAVCSGRAEMGAYALWFQNLIRPVDCVPLSIGSTTQHVVRRFGDARSFCFTTVDPGARVNLSVTTSTMQPHVTLFGPNGVEVASATCSCCGVATISGAAVPAGRYLVVVRDGACSGSGEIGSFTIVLACASAGC